MVIRVLICRTKSVDYFVVSSQRDKIQYRKCLCRDEDEERREPHRRPAVAGQLPQNLRENGVSRIPDHLPLALFSTCTCANIRFFFPLFDARSSVTSSSASTDRCPWRAHTLLPLLRVQCRAERGAEAAWPLDEQDPELEFLPTELGTMIRPLCRRDIRVLPCFSNDS